MCAIVIEKTMLIGSVDTVRDSVSVDTVHDSVSVDTVHDSVSVDTLHDSVSVDTVHDSVSVLYPTLIFYIFIKLPFN